MKTTKNEYSKWDMWPLSYFFLAFILFYKNKKSIILRLGLCFFVFQDFVLESQTFNNRRCFNVPTRQEFVLDTFAVYAPSIELVNKNSNFKFDPERNSIFISDTLHDSLSVCFRVLNLVLGKTYKSYDFGDYSKNQHYSTKNNPKPSFKTLAPLEKEELFSFNSFSKSGNFTRGVSAGNTQNAFVNSSLNLQLDGYISEKMKLTGAISDQNMAVQPSGYTQNVQAFDRVYLQLEQENTFKIQAGDMVLKNRKESHYLRYLKNVQGLQGQFSYKMSSKDTASTTLGISFAKGKFASIQILGSALVANTTDQTLEEGMLGPYRLNGPNNERFVQVIANSEKIFLDGRELARGFNNDYTIDYNSGEFKFTTNVLVTKYSRVRIDFEYADRNYARTNYQASHEQKIGKWAFALDYYSEKDNARSPLATSLNDADKQRLSQVGDTIEKAYVISGDSVGYAAGAIRYRLLADSTVAGISYKNIYVFDSQPATAVYNVTFTYLGQGNGDYMQQTSNITNGKVYEWRAPVAGIKQGSYMPQKIVATPKLKSMATAAIKFQKNKAERFYSELAVSQNDLNLYSNLNDNDNSGKALKIGYENTGKRIYPKKKMQYFSGVDLEVLDRNFSAIDRFRTVDFDRDWNASASTETNNLNSNNVIKAEDQIFTFTLGVKDSLSSIKYVSVIRNKDNDAKGSQQKIDVLKKYKKTNWKASYFSMENNLTDRYSTWVKASSDVSVNFKTLKQGYIYEKEQNRQYNRDNDSIVRSLQNYELHRLYLGNGDSLKKNKFKLYTEQRRDGVPVAGVLKQNSISRTQNLFLSTKLKKKHDIATNLTYRNTENLLLADTSNLKHENNFISRLDWAALVFDKAVKSELTFTTATGRELKKEYMYIAVPTGQGNYTWRDDNNDGIQQLNEFYEAVNFDEKNYLKTFVPSSQYIAAYSSNYIYKLNINPPQAWSKKKNILWRKLTKVSSNTYYTLEKSSTDNDLLFRITPWANKADNTTLLHVNSNFRNSIFWNRQNIRWGLEYTFQKTDQKQLLTYGFEGKYSQAHQFNLRKSLGKKHTLRTLVERTNRNSTSDYLENKNYTVLGGKIRQEWLYQPSNKLRIGLSLAFQFKDNPKGSEYSQNKELGVETRFAKTSTRTFQASFKYNKINYNAATNTPIAYEMLDALQPGDNYYWNISYTQKVLNGLQLTLNYDGRKSALGKTIHIAKVQATALF
jgi:hypothetical protein